MTKESKAKNMPKYEAYKRAFGQIKKAISMGFPIEAIALEESIISDRLQSAAEGMGLNLKPKKSGRTAGFAELLNLVETKPEFESLRAFLAASNGSVETLRAWGRKRNDFVHNFVHSAPGAAPVVSAASFDETGRIVASEGLRLARMICSWSKKSISAANKSPRPKKETFRLIVTAKKGIDQSHCAHSKFFDDAGNLSRLDPCELVQNFGGVYDTHGISMPLKGSFLWVVGSDGESRKFALSNPSVAVAFYESPKPDKSKDPVVFARAVWDDHEWEMSQLADSRLESQTPFDISKVSIGVRLIPDLKGGFEKIVSAILYDGRIIHSVSGQMIGLGRPCRFTLFQKGSWKKLSASARSAEKEGNASDFWG